MISRRSFVSASPTPVIAVIAHRPPPSFGQLRARNLDAARRHEERMATARAAEGEEVARPGAVDVEALATTIARLATADDKV